MSTAPRILVVDDLADWQATLTGLLKDAGFSVDAVSSQAEAIEFLERNSYQIAVLDLRLDESDEANIGGIDLAQIIHERWSSVIIILITGYGSPERVQQALAPDKHQRKIISDYIPKTQIASLPYRVKQLLPTG